MSLIVGGDRSSSGKTTVTLALLAYLRRHYMSVQSFKVGPDYIDPMFHTYVTGRACRNLDPMLTSEVYVRECFARHSQTAEFCLIEGVMGLFDGIRLTDSGTGISNFASTAHIALLLNLPVLLVIDCSKLSGSVAAIARGFTTFDPRIKFAGLVLNRVGSDRHLQLLQEAIAPLNLPILGVLRRQQNITIPDRHLGLIPTDEMPELNTLIDDLALMAKCCFNWEELLPLLKSKLKNQNEGSEQQLSMHIPPKDIVTPQSEFVKGFSEKKSPGKSKLKSADEGSEQHLSMHILPKDIVTPQLEFVKGFSEKKSPIFDKIVLAVARDAAFNFYYQDNLDLLVELGAELIFFSPLTDTSLPPETQGLYFGGGFPEVFGEQLSKNIQMRESVKTAIIKGMPTYAECGGLMYLCQAILDFNNNSWEMVGILPAAAAMAKKLTLGYRQAIALQNSALLKEGDKVFGHEFHRSELIANRSSELIGNRSSELIGNRSSELIGNRSSELTGNRSSELTGNRSSELTGNRSSELIGNRSSELIGNRSSELIGNRSSELIGNRSSELIGNRQDACSTLWREASAKSLPLNLPGRGMPLWKIWRADEESRDSLARLEGWQIYRVHASYIHLHWGGRVEIPQGFLEHCQQFSCQKYDDGVE